MKGPLARAQGHRESTDTAIHGRHPGRRRRRASAAAATAGTVRRHTTAGMDGDATVPLGRAGRRPVPASDRIGRAALTDDAVRAMPCILNETQSWTRAFVMCARAPAPPGPARPGIRPDNGTEPNPGGPRSRAGGVSGELSAELGGGAPPRGREGGRPAGGRRGRRGSAASRTASLAAAEGHVAQTWQCRMKCGRQVGQGCRPHFITRQCMQRCRSAVALSAWPSCSRNGKQAQRSMSFVVFIYPCSESPHPLPSLAPALPTPPPAGVGAEAGGRARGRPRVTTAVAATATEAAAASGGGSSGDGGDGNGSAVTAMAAATPSPPPPLTALTPISAHCRRQRPLKTRRRQRPLEIPVAG